MNITAVVKEEGSDLSEQTTRYLKVIFPNVSLKIVGKEKYFQTGLPYSAKIKFKNIEKPIVNQICEICCDLIDRKKSWKSLETACSNFTTDVTGSVPFTIPPLISSISVIDITVNSFYIQLFGIHISMFYR